MPNDTKQCTACNEAKPLVEFHTHKSTKSGVTSACKPCTNRRSKEWREANRERYRESYRQWEARTLEERRPKRRAADLKRVYGLTPERHDALLESQGGVCAICSKPGLKLVVDHDHATGKVRGLLCHHCNVGIGYLRDDIEILASAQTYLSK